jgi:hypothetical protein
MTLSRHTLSMRITGRQALLLLNYPELSGPQARRVAAVQIAAEERAQAKAAKRQHTSAPFGALSLSNAKILLLAKIARMIENMSAAPSLPAQPPAPKVTSDAPLEVAQSPPPATNDDAKLAPSLPLVSANGTSAELSTGEKPSLEAPQEFGSPASLSGVTANR